MQKYFDTWKQAKEYRRVFTRFSATAKKIGFALAEFSFLLEQRGYIRLIDTPSGKRYVLPAKLKWTEDEILAHVMELDNDRLNNGA
jgi:hypothetical protein